MAGGRFGNRIPQRRTRFLLVALAMVLAFFYLTVDRESSWVPYDLHPGLPQPMTPPGEGSSGTVPGVSPPVVPSPLPVPIAATPATEAASANTPASSPASTDSWTPEQCANFRFESWANARHGPLSKGRRQFPLVRPPLACRTFKLPALEALIERVKGLIHDPDLARLWENAYPNTLDTMIKWRGYANDTDKRTGEWTVTDEELTYVITGDIDAMWLRDSASQIYSYLPLLEASDDPNSLASLWRGLINSQARYITISPYCHSFQPPVESGILPTLNAAFSQNNPIPSYNPELVFDCKWELDSLASFLQISVAYYERTGDVNFFKKYSWVDAVEAAVDAAGAMRLGTYSKEGKVEHSAWTFTGWTNRGSETLTNDGLGNPTKENGMVRTAFRPSDDATIYQLLVPANMMFAKYLEEASVIMEQLDDTRAANLTTAMREFALGIRIGIDRDAIVDHKEFGDIFAYEIDGFGSVNLMDDANVPSLLAMPFWNYTNSRFALPPPREGSYPRDYAQIYRNTRRFVLSEANPYFMRGPVISAVGGPHLGPGKAWPMAAIVAAMTAFDPLSGVEDSNLADEVAAKLMMVVNSTAGTGLVHETVNSWNEKDWTRAWFGWANGLFGELILKIVEADEMAEAKNKTKTGLLSRSWQ